MHLIMLGPPGSGKGTMAIELSKIFAIAHISTGDIFRNNIKQKTPLGVEAKSYIDRGLLVPDSVTIAMVEDRLAQPDCQDGYLLDGFPRTLTQAHALAELLAGNGKKIELVINLELPDAKVVDRLSARRLCNVCGRGYNTESQPPKIENICDVCGSRLIQRDDDRPETIMSRLVAYHEQTAPLIAYYQEQGTLFRVVNDGEVGSNLAKVTAAIKATIGRDNV
jgi:adenylate kinase